MSLAGQEQTASAGVLKSMAWAMNDSIVKVGNNPLAVAVAAAFVAGAIGFFGGQYNNNSTAQATELQSHDRDIEHLKALVANDEIAITNVSNMANQFGALKTAVEAQTNALNGLQQRVEAMDHWLRPDPTPGQHSR